MPYDLRHPLSGSDEARAVEAMSSVRTDSQESRTRDGGGAGWRLRREGGGRTVRGSRRGHRAGVDRRTVGEAACHGVEHRRKDADAERLWRGARAEGGRRTEVEVDAGARAARVGGAVECCARRRRVTRRERLDVARRERLGEELLRAGCAGGEEEERRADRTALAGGTVRVERVRGAG